MNDRDVALHLAELQELVAPDGGSLELIAVDTALRSVALRLVLDGVECPECVLPGTYLEALALDVLRRSLPELDRVLIADPRIESARA